MRHRQRGQVLAYGLAALITVATVIVLLYNAGQTSSEKSRAVNAADAAAYSGAVWVARQLNFMAYTNRAMIANHIAVGHFVSYMSWIRYVEDSSDTIRNVTRFIPYVNVATEILADWAVYVREGTEYFGDVFVPATDALNRSMYAAQAAAKASMLGLVGAGSLTPLHEVMQYTVRRYDPAYRVNDPGDLATLTGAVSGVQVAAELVRIFEFTDDYNAGNDDGRLKRLVEDSLGPSRDWISGNRGWTECLFITCARLPSNLKAQKTGSTEHRAEGDELGWKAADALGFWRSKKKKWWSSYRWSGGTIADGKATADEFDSGYAGVYGYHALASTASANQSLFLSAYTTFPISAARLKPLLQMKPATSRMAALARAEIHHERPPSFGTGAAEEFSNLFNPFWRARLTAYKPFFVY